MGYNSVLFVLNDCMHTIDEHTDEWWQHARRALGKAMSKAVITFGFRGHANYCQAVWCEHADSVALIAAGGNHASVIGYTMGENHGTPEDNINLLKAIAEQLGYRLVKKRERKPTWQDIPSPGQNPASVPAKSTPPPIPEKIRTPSSKKSARSAATASKTSSSSKSSASTTKAKAKKTSGRKKANHKKAR